MLKRYAQGSIPQIQAMGLGGKKKSSKKKSSKRKSSKKSSKKTQY